MDAVLVLLGFSQACFIIAIGYLLYEIRNARKDAELARKDLLDRLMAHNFAEFKTHNRLDTIQKMRNNEDEGDYIPDYHDLGR